MNENQVESETVKKLAGELKQHSLAVWSAFTKSVVWTVRRKLLTMLHKWKIHKLETRENKEVWEEDYELIENEGLFEEYLEMGRFFSLSDSRRSSL